jgi:tetratricopeptide (TPR) repeat protein
MTKKKEQQVAVSPEDEAQAQAVLEQFHTIAGTLRLSADQQQAEEALAPVTELTEAAQMALLKALSNEHDIDAADVLSAINVLSPIKNVRKEARRSLIRLEQFKIYPQWEPTVVRISPFEAMQTAMNMEESSNPPRFWKGIRSDTRDLDEIQMMLFWEQGKDYKDVRVLGFRLDFLYDGVKDFYTMVESKRNAEKLIEHIAAGEELLDCSLAKGRRLIEEALAVNKKHGTPADKDFRLTISLVNKLVLENADIGEDEDEDEEDQFDEDVEDEDEEISPDLTPAQVVVGFVEAWADEEYERAYNYLSSDSRLHEGLTQEEWAELREEWAEEAAPDYFQPSFVHEREIKKSGIWLPNPFSRGTTQAYKEVDAGWSIELADTAEMAALPELPEETVLYEETGRRWFWASYKLVEEPGGWRIQDIVDEGKNAQNTPAVELRKRIEQHNREAEEITKKHNPKDPDALDYLGDVLWRLVEVVYYEDALIAQDPLDEQAYFDAFGRAKIFQDDERSIVYLEGIARYFPQHQAGALRQIGSLQMKLSEEFNEEEDEVRGEHFLNLAEENLRKSLAIEDNLDGHMILADVLHDIGGDEKLVEADDELRKAQAMTKEKEDLEIIESSLGHNAMDRNEYDVSLSHYQRLVEMNPSYPGARYNIGRAHQLLGNNGEAIDNFKQAIEIEPGNLNAYAELAMLYVSKDQLSMAHKVIEEGIAANPDRPDLHLLLVSQYIQSKDFVRAEEHMKEAERIDPDDDTVMTYRHLLTISKYQRQLEPGSQRKKFKKR